MSDSNRSPGNLAGGSSIPSGNSTSTPQQQQQPPAPPSSLSSSSSSSSTSSSSPPPPQTTPQTTPSGTSPSPPPPTTSSSSAPPPPQSSTSTSSEATPPTTFLSSTSPPPPSASAPAQPTASKPVVTVTPGKPVTTIEVVTSVTTPGPAAPTTSAKTSSSAVPAQINPGGDGNGNGVSQPAKVAIGVVCPIAAIALLALLGLWWWRKRKARQESEEERRKEVEDYAYNPNADPTVPAVGLGPDSYEMRDGELGYRGWGSTTVGGSMGRKTSTTMSGGMTAAALSDGGGHTRGNLSDSKTDSNLDSSSSPDGEILGAMGPSASNNRNGDVHRGPSNASSSYSATGRSEGSDGGMYPHGGAYYEQYGQTPYGGDQPAQELGGQAVIRDNPARRNTRIENPSHYPQQSAGIAQNF